MKAATRAGAPHRLLHGLCVAGVVLSACWSVVLPAHASAKVTWLTVQDDPRLSRSRLERAPLGHPTGPALDAFKVALAEAGVSLDIDVQAVTDAAGAKAAAARADKAGHLAVVADLPAAWLLAAADGTKAAVLNVGSADDHLRAADCRRNLLHLAPSDRMKADALAQWLVARRWKNILLLHGSGPQDATRLQTVQASLKRYALVTVGTKPFKLSADPRERDLANPLLLTQGSYDAVWVVDSDGEFAQSLPYRTALPRPVVGDGGLVAVAWSARFERYGAPQVTRRLIKAAGRPMGAHDWPAWLAGKAVAEAAAPAKATPASVLKALNEVELDGSKGVNMGFRPWDGQLRQPLLLTDGQGIAGMAPLEGVLHPKNTLDTLGADAGEKLCKARP